MAMELVLVCDGELTTMLYWSQRLYNFAVDAWFGFGDLKGSMQLYIAYVYKLVCAKNDV